MRVAMRLSPNKSCPLRAARSGATLVEVVISCVILAVVALGTAAYIYLSRTGVVIQRNKRIAIEAANRRLEEIQGLGYPALTNSMPKDFAVHYLRDAGNSWGVTSTNPNETVTINGAVMPMTTTAQYTDVDGAGKSYDCIAITVQTAYRATANAQVTLQTIFGP